MEIIQSILTNSDCYRAGRKITVKGLMIHSIGTPQPDPMVFVRNWNRPGVNACVHAFLGADGKVYQTLPWNHRGWHGASGPNGSVNNTHIGVEMTEPNTIIYTGGSTFRNLDQVRTRIFVMATYLTAVELFAKLAKDFNLDPLRHIISHAEGYRLGIASNHGDPEHLWRFHGLTMNGFRAAVKAKMEQTVVKPTPTPAPLGDYPVAYKDQEGENVKILQRNLVKLGILKASDVDGMYGPITTKAVEVFQRSRNIEVDGQAGAVTQSELKKVITALEAPKPELPDTSIKEESLQGTVKVIYKGNEGLNVRKAPNFDDASIDAVVRFGEVFTVVARAGDFYKLKSGLYITTNELYVEFRKPVVVIKPKVYKTTTFNLNMRKGPAVKYERILTIPQNTKVEILETTNGWDKVSYNGQAGWASAEYLKSASTAAPVVKTITVKINTPKLNIRKDPTTASEIVGSVKEGEVFTIVETKDGWGKLKSGVGWIYLDYTTKL